MSDSVKRFLRTLFQAGSGGIVTGALVGLHIITGEQAAVVGPLLTLLFTALQNALEDAGVVPKMLKD